jgi:type I restriction enzyme R subunit
MINDYTMPDFDEASYSQIPAIVQLCGLGYEYLTRSRARELRIDNSQYILRDIAVAAISKINPDISEKSILDAVVDLENVKMDGGVVKASESIYSDLLAGKSVSEIIDGRRVSPQMKFIDFANPKNNTFHVAAEFEISEMADRRPDIVLFINGIPMCVIECKKGSVPVEEAVNQMLRNQSGGNTPKFFLFPQLLIATNGHSLKYATMLTPAEYWSVWKESDISQLPGAAPNVVKQISEDLSRGRYNSTEIPDNEQSRGIYNLLRPARILNLIHGYVFYDGGKKKVARYQQYFAIQKTMNRIISATNPLMRGGLIWHTQGSGKSLTMVMLARELTERFGNPRIIIVTDRRDLDKQISDTFAACNIKKNVVRVKSAAELLGYIKNKSVDVLTTLVQKFNRVADKNFIDDDPNIFILIDEAHRTQGGEANAWMNTILPNACQIAFTGTPLMSHEKASATKFGGIIDAYTISEAEADGAILPLIYQARWTDMQAKANMLDEFYVSITEPMTEDQRKDFEKKANLSKMMQENSNRIEMIAMDIRKHYQDYFQGTGLKGQIVMPSKYAAVMCKKALDLLGGVQSEVIISDTNAEENDDNLPEMKKIVADYLTEERRRHGTLEAREKKIIDDFRDNTDGTELLIVVDKLLTGFDAPRDTVLYLAKQLKDHNLLQAIARVNRVFNGDKGKQKKESGIIIDYSKNAEHLRSAMELFSNYDPEDVAGALVSTAEKAAELETIYQNLLSTFRGVPPNAETQIRFLKDEAHEEQRERFYSDVNRFINVFATCLSLPDFNKHFDGERLEKISLELKRFAELKKNTRLAMGETIDFSKYRDQLHKILDKYIEANGVEELSKEINLSDVREFNQFVEDAKNGMSDRSKAEAIAAQTKRIIKERYRQDEAFYQKFSERIEKLLEELKSAKKEDIANLLDRMHGIQRQVADYDSSDIPASIRAQKIYHPFYRNMKDALGAADDAAAEIVKNIVRIIQENRCVDWDKNITIQRIVIDKIDDYLYDVVRGEMGIELAPDIIHTIEQMAWDLAVENKENI